MTTHRAFTWALFSPRSKLSHDTLHYEKRWRMRIYSHLVSLMTARTPPSISLKPELSIYYPQFFSAFFGHFSSILPFEKWKWDRLPSFSFSHSSRSSVSMSFATSNERPAFKQSSQDSLLYLILFYFILLYFTRTPKLGLWLQPHFSFSSLSIPPIFFSFSSHRPLRTAKGN